MTPSLPEHVQTVQLGNKEIYLLGTAHISKQSILDVQSTIQAVKPDTVCVELCPSRYQAMMHKQAWQELDIFKIIKEKKALYVLVQLIMSGLYHKIGKKLGVQPGAEMLEAVQQAHKLGAELVLADREVNITLKRVWGFLSWWQKMKLIFQLLTSLILSEEVTEKDIEEMKDKDQLEVVMSEVAEKFPEVKERLIDERDTYLAQKIRSASGKKIVAVVGAGHLPGIVKKINQKHHLAPLEELPPKGLGIKIIKWTIPALIIGLITLGFFFGKHDYSWQSIWIWVMVNGTLSALGVALALAHPLTIVVTFLAAPLTSLNPAIAAGWVAGLVQAWLKKPTVADLEDLPNALSSFKGFWLNPLCRILLVVALANVGSSLGTLIAGSWIATKFF